MTIRTRLLLITMGVMAALLLTAVAMVFDVSAQKARMATQTQLSELDRTVVLLIALTQEHRINASARTRQQWEALYSRWEALGRQVADSGEPVVAALVRPTADALQDTRKRFDELNRLMDSGVHHEVVEVTFRHLIMSLLDTEEVLRQHTAGFLTEGTERAGRARALLIAIIGALALGILALVVLVHRSVLNPLLKLRTSAEHIADGRLETRTGLRGHDEVGQLGAALDHMAQRLQDNAGAKSALVGELRRSNEALQQFAYAASHDLQEPLRTITSYIQLIERRYGSTVDPKLAELMQYVVEGAHRMQQLIQDLLVFSRVTTQAAPSTPVDLNTLLGEVCRDLTSTIEATRATLSIDPLPVIRADGAQMRQLFQNLLSNALKFHDPARAPRIHVRAHPGRQDAAVRISVCDNGIGIPAEFRARIFQVFQRLHTREAYPGTGIGLAVCQKIVKRHGGHIDVSDAPGAGTCFTIVLPEHPPETSPVALATGATPDAPGDPHAARG